MLNTINVCSYMASVFLYKIKQQLLDRSIVSIDRTLTELNGEKWQ